MTVTCETGVLMCARPGGTEIRVLTDSIENFCEDAPEAIALLAQEEPSFSLHVDLVEQDVVSDAIRVVWNFWQISQSDFHRRDCSGVVDLGCLDEGPTS
jgi:hypothetical protein